MILTIINVKIFYAMKTLKDRLKGKSYRLLEIELVGLDSKH